MVVAASWDKPSTQKKVVKAYSNKQVVLLHRDLTTTKNNNQLDIEIEARKAYKAVCLLSVPESVCFPSPDCSQELLFACLYILNHIASVLFIYLTVRCFFVLHIFFRLKLMVSA